ncbi:hypothetical protein KCU88_g5092, partial [Aureobasidium melanogenum]
MASNQMILEQLDAQNERLDAMQRVLEDTQTSKIMPDDLELLIPSMREDLADFSRVCRDRREMEDRHRKEIKAVQEESREKDDQHRREADELKSENRRLQEENSQQANANLNRSEFLEMMRQFRDSDAQISTPARRDASGAIVQRPASDAASEIATASAAAVDTPMPDVGSNPVNDVYRRVVAEFEFPANFVVATFEAQLKPFIHWKGADEATIWQAVDKAAMGPVPTFGDPESPDRPCFFAHLNQKGASFDKTKAQRHTHRSCNYCSGKADRVCGGVYFALGVARPFDRDNKRKLIPSTYDPERLPKVDAAGKRWVWRNHE